MGVVQPLVFFLCVVTSAACMLLLLRGWWRTGNRLLFWSALCFVGLAVNNLLVFLDIIIFPTEVNLLPFRHIASIAAISVLLWGFIWETD
jgi:hypothetical protein